MAASLLAKIGGGFALAGLAAVFVPRLGDADAAVPDLAVLLATGAAVGLLTTGALYLGLTRDLGLPQAIALYAVGYNALVVLVKFVLSPRGLYEVSEEGRYEAFIDPSTTGGAIFVAAAVFVLYAVALLVIYRVCRRRLGHAPTSWKRVLIIAALVAALLVATGGLPLVLAFGGLEYVDYLFASGVSALVALALAGAVSLAGIAFRESAVRASLLGDATLLLNVFWVALAFLALYHALWVVYVLVLTTIWPLKVITPK
ncbi:MAG: hypothetical protein H0V94_01945 [Actinobacteria bacterium]|nr:hypothetical protein [Actinomycetota bacterium]